jgi:hypothetical protein
MSRQERSELMTGLVLAVLGGAFAAGSFTALRVPWSDAAGTYFASILGICMSVTALVILMRVQASDPRGRHCVLRWRPAACLLVGNVAFAVLLEGLPSLVIPAMGLIIAMYALTFIVSLAVPYFHPFRVALIGTALAAASYLLCVLLLQLPVRIWPTLVPGW